MLGPIVQRRVPRGASRFMGSAWEAMSGGYTAAAFLIT